MIAAELAFGPLVAANAKDNAHIKRKRSMQDILTSEVCGKRAQ
jgi:hypothetical protein